MSHERSITVKRGELWYNIPTVVGDRKLTTSQAARMFAKHQIEAHSVHDNVDSAVEAAIKRSQMSGIIPKRKPR